MLGLLCEYEECRASAEEAVEIYRAVHEERPNAFALDLGESLTVLSDAFHHVHRAEEALTAAADAVKIFRPLAESRPDVFLPDLAHSLKTLAQRLGNVDQHRGALEAAREAVRHYRTLYEAQPAAFAVGYSTSLRVLAKRLRTNNDSKAALEEISEAINVLAPVYERHPEAGGRWMNLHLEQYFLLALEIGDHVAPAQLGRVMATDLQKIRMETRHMASVGDRSVSIGGHATGAQIVTGDHNRTKMAGVTVALPSGADVNIREEVAALRKALEALQTPNGKKIDRALRDAVEEAESDDPDKDKIGAAIKRAVELAARAEGFSAHLERIATRLAPVAAWLGKNWPSLLAIGGITFAG